jgi:serine/threonine-protein kinase
MTQEDPVPVRAGDLLAGKYRVESVLGMGGMGVVVAARHEQLDKRVAIKFVRPEALGNREAVERFLREARAAVKLKSEHAARVLDVGTLESGAPYMVMEFLEGSDLGQMLEANGQLTIEQAADWIVQACEALAEAHAAGIVHRDLKPQNLFLARTVGDAFTVKVLDFGVSKSMAALSGAAGSLTHTRAMLGSPLYMAPEQMRSSRNVDARADVWALGVVLYELLTNARPFEAETLPELCLMVVSDPPRPVQELRADIPATLCEIIQRCLSKDPAERFANAGEVAEALAPFASPSVRPIAIRARKATLAVTPIPAGSEPSIPSLGAGRSTPQPRTSTPQTRVTTPQPPNAPVPRTPAAWGSGAAERKARRQRATVRIIVVLAGAAIGAAAVLVLRPHRQTAPPPSPVPTVASEPPLAAPSVVPAPVAPSPVASEAPDPVSTVVAAPIEKSLPGPTTAAARPAPSESTSGNGNERIRPPAPLPKPPPAASHAPAKPKVHDDDIPALR